jgi:RNA polymerase sigma-70 factor (ECF subfamily)
LETDIIRRAAQGDEEAYETLVRDYQDAVFRLAYLFTGDAADAQDVAQDAFIAAFRALPRFDLTRPLRPWLLQITANTARNRRRSIGRYVNALRRLVRLDPPGIPDIEGESARRIEAQGIREAMQRLSQVDKEVIYLRYFLELSVNETAEILNVEPGTVKSRLSRALGRLRDVVKQDFPLLYEGRIHEQNA